MIRSNSAFPHRKQIITSLVKRRLATVHKQRRRSHRCRIDLARMRRTRTYNIQVNAVRDPLAPHHRLLRVCDSRYHVRVSQSLFRTRNDLNRKRNTPTHLISKQTSVVHVSTDHPTTLDRSHFSHRLQMRPRLHTSANNRQLARIGTRQQISRDTRHSRGANRRNRGSIHQRQQLAVLSAEEQHCSLVRILSPRRISGKHTNRLQSVSGLITTDVRRHQPHHPCRIRRAHDGAQRLVHLPARELRERLAHQPNALLHRQKLNNFIVIQDQDLHVGLSVSQSLSDRRYFIP